jgi:maltose alpha-D-glucosyltransferase/alpha-amylase
MPRLFMGLRMEDRHPITEILRITPPIPENCQWCIFLRNHDELTLEMVTDIERDYMYDEYATDKTMRINLGIRRRLAPMMENDWRGSSCRMDCLMSCRDRSFIMAMKLNGRQHLFGDATGSNADAMEWRTNAGFSSADPERLYSP